MYETECVVCGAELGTRISRKKSDHTNWCGNPDVWNVEEWTKPETVKIVQKSGMCSVCHVKTRDAIIQGAIGGVDDVL
jgi:hypothetical protein